MNTPLPDIEVKKQKFKCYLDDDGMFCCAMGGELLTETIRRPTRKALQDTIASYLGKKPVSIPFVQIYDRGWDNEKVVIKRGIALSIHDGNGNVLVRIEGQKETDQLRSYGSGDILRPNVDVKKLNLLAKQKDDARDKYAKFIEANKIDLTKLVRKAMEEQK
jgi:hypothetical protein